MPDPEFETAIRAICESDTRYPPDAYGLVRAALTYTSRMLNKPSSGPGGHVSCRELLDGIREFIINEYGPMSLTCLESINIRQTLDFGAIVFNMIEAGILGRTEEDKLSDFRDVYSFTDAFVQPFQPVCHDDTPMEEN